MTSWCFQAPKKYPTCNEFFHQRETSKMSVQGWKAPFMAIVICLDTLIFLKILSTFVDGVVGQMTIDICQMLLEHGSIKAKDSLLYVSWGGAPHRMPVATRHPKVIRFKGYIGQFPRFNPWDNYPLHFLKDFSDSINSHSRSSQLSPPRNTRTLISPGFNLSLFIALSSEQSQKSRHIPTGRSWKISPTHRGRWCLRIFLDLRGHSMTPTQTRHYKGNHPQKIHTFEPQPFWWTLHSLIPWKIEK